MENKTNIPKKLFDRYVEFAKSKNGVLLDLQRPNPNKRPTAFYRCEKGHEFSNFSGYARWCPRCADEIRKIKNTQRNKANRKYTMTGKEFYDLMLEKWGVEYLTPDIDPSESPERLQFRLKDGTIKVVRLYHALNGNIGGRERKKERTIGEHIEKAKRLCAKHNYEFIDIQLGKKNSFASAKITFLNKAKVTRTMQGAWFLNNNAGQNPRISKPTRQIESYLLNLGITPTLEHFIRLEESDFVGWDKYYDLKDKEKIKSKGKTDKSRRCLYLDIYIPSHNIAIEYHGAVWHDAFKYPSKRFECAFKREACRKRGIHLIQIWQHEWSGKRDQIKGILRNKLGLTPNKLNARDCIIKKLENQEAYDFIGKYHLQGKPTSLHAAYGMFHNDMLVAAVSIKKEGTEVYKGLYLDRLVVHPDYSIRGSLSKFNAFLKNNHEHLYTLIDLRLHNPDNWIKSGWKLEKIMPPSYSYFNTETNKHYDKRKFKKVPEDFVNTTEYGNESAYVRSLFVYCKLWNCGRARLVLERA